MGRNGGIVLVRVFLILTCLLFIIFCNGCRNLDHLESNAEIQKGFPDVELYNSDITYTDNGVRQFDIKSPKILRFESNQLIILKGGIEAEFYNNSDQPSGYLTADGGEIMEKDQFLLAKGHVVVQSDSGMVLYADSLYYDPKVKKIKSDGFVTIITDLDSLSGVGFVASPDLSEWEIKNSSGVTWREWEQRKDE